MLFLGSIWFVIFGIGFHLFSMVLAAQPKVEPYYRYPGDSYWEIEGYRLSPQPEIDIYFRQPLGDIGFTRLHVGYIHGSTLVVADLFDTTKVMFATVPWWYCYYSPEKRVEKWQASLVSF